MSNKLPIEIPGFFYDPEKKKYFKITSSNNPDVLPISSITKNTVRGNKYTSNNIKANEILKKELKARQRIATIKKIQCLQLENDLQIYSKYSKYGQQKTIIANLLNCKLHVFSIKYDTRIIKNVQNIFRVDADSILAVCEHGSFLLKNQNTYCFSSEMFENFNYSSGNENIQIFQDSINNDLLIVNSDTKKLIIIDYSLRKIIVSNDAGLKKELLNSNRTIHQFARYTDDFGKPFYLISSGGRLSGVNNEGVLEGHAILSNKSDILAFAKRNYVAKGDPGQHFWNKYMLCGFRNGNVKLVELSKDIGHPLQPKKVLNQITLVSSNNRLENIIDIYLYSPDSTDYCCNKNKYAFIFSAQSFGLYQLCDIDPNYTHMATGDINARFKNTSSFDKKRKFPQLIEKIDFINIFQESAIIPTATTLIFRKYQKFLIYGKKNTPFKNFQIYLLDELLLANSDLPHKLYPIATLDEFIKSHCIEETSELISNVLVNNLVCEIYIINVILVILSTNVKTKELTKVYLSPGLIDKHTKLLDV
ncbi:uncharacterized protein SCDLUD_001417 [Saccharomycodes ludwigii]|uniref:uncharacterized protein n=1 Tax=Saccharomycodes ludwigii TaxID=36035 RepID=UPI001E879729|nr:hypothetical protein SCDLUD_001417 [Saccharomycodes ludwigii]KAH3901649.1 hypothetical protein SCDLUD_001417 [Saccharomycodes ludwigii]